MLGRRERCRDQEGRSEVSVVLGRLLLWDVPASKSRPLCMLGKLSRDTHVSCFSIYTVFQLEFVE